MHDSCIMMQRTRARPKVERQEHSCSLFAAVAGALITLASMQAGVPSSALLVRAPHHDPPRSNICSARVVAVVALAAAERAARAT